MAGEGKGERRRRNLVHRHGRLARRRASRLDPTVRGLIWAALAGLLFVMLNAAMRGLTLQMDPFEVQLLRYLAGILVMLPLVMRAGWRSYLPRNIRGQFLRGAVHAFGLALWFLAMPHITLADITAIGFTWPLLMCGIAAGMVLIR